MKSRMLISILVIALAAAVIGGGTLAWFTAKTDLENVFTAGTVMIAAEEDTELTDELGNVNPGDCLKKVFEICNVGTKGIALRMKFEGTWTFNEEWLEENWNKLCFSALPIPTDASGWAAFFEGLIDPASFKVTGWVYDEDDGWWYYDGNLAAGACLEMVEIMVCFDGESMGNHYQAATYTLKAYIEAVQSSNFAPFHVWGYGDGPVN
jgi:predicted ribosomally synthesized peptide with SipW-like signal peptide